MKETLQYNYYYKTDNGVIIQDDCFNVFPYIKDKSIDLILADLPFGATKNKWDSTLDVDELWKQYKRIIKDNGAIILFGQDKFTAMMMLSEPKLHRYNLIWDKELISGFLNANRMPLRQHEDIMIFYKKLPTYNPQKQKGNPSHTRGKGNNGGNNNYGEVTRTDNSNELGDMKHPTSILKFPKPHPSVAIHPTQKSLELCEWLIRAYSNEGNIILDNTSGVCTTGLACENTNRKWICIEKDFDDEGNCLGYCEKAVKRLKGEIQ